MNKILDLTCLNAEYTKKLNEIAANCKKEYTEFVDKYSRRYGSCYLWWALPLSSRNIYLDDTFQSICYLHLCRQVIFSDNCIERIVVNSKALYDVLIVNCRQELLKKKIVLEYREKSSKLTSVIARMVQEFMSQVKKFLQIKGWLDEEYDIKESITLVDTPVLSSCFRNGKYEDRYFNDIQNYTKRNIYFVPSLILNSSMEWREFVYNVKESKNYKFIFKQSFLNLFDYIQILKYYILCLILSMHKYEYENMDVTPLIRDSLLKGCTCIPSIEGILNYQFIKHLNKTNIKVENLISWYEGRPSEIMLDKAFREYYSDANCVGYEGFPLLEFCLSLYLSDEQVRQKSAPLKMTIPGEVYAKQAKQFCDMVNLVKVPILRNKYMYEGNRACLNSKKKIFVVLPNSRELAGEMLHMVNNYMKLHYESYDVIIKNHPVLTGRTIDFYLKEKLYFVPQYVEGNLIECMKDVDLAYLSCSTASLEVLSQDVFLVNLCPSGKLINTGIPNGIDDKLYRIVYDDKETFEAFDIGLRTRENPSNKLNISSLLEAVNEETVNRMWN